MNNSVGCFSVLYFSEKTIRKVSIVQKKLEYIIGPSDLIHGFRISFLVWFRVICTEKKQTLIGWKLRTLTYYPIREFVYLKLSFVQITQNHKKLIRNPCIGCVLVIDGVIRAGVMDHHQIRVHLKRVEIKFTYLWFWLVHFGGFKDESEVWFF